MAEENLPGGHTVKVTDDGDVYACSQCEVPSFTKDQQDKLDQADNPKEKAKTARELAQEEQIIEHSTTAKEESEDAIQDEIVLGGKHKDTKVAGKKHGTESYHPIADASSDIATDDAPAIRMGRDDHVYRTGNWGSRKASKKFREKQKQLVKQGKYDEALEMGIKDIKRQNPGNYDEHIEQMLESMPRKLDDSIDWDAFKRKQK